MVAAYAGDTAREEATQLATELRQQHGLKTYLHSEHFDFTDAVDGLRVDRYNRPRKMRYAQAEQYDEIAVMVGDFTAVDDPELQRTLKQVKRLTPSCLKGLSPYETSLRFASLRTAPNQITGGRQRTPLAKAFVTRNPLLPREYFVPQGIDKLTLDMNRGVKHSLLDCAGKYSVRVATFGGKVVIDQKRVQEIESGDARLESKLEQAALQAHKLTEELRRRGVEAYEFHDRFESIVTVGSFDSIGQEGADGEINLNRDVYAVMHKFAARRREFNANGSNMAGLEPRQLIGIPFDVQPIPVVVPQRSIAADYAGSNSLFR